MYCWLFTGCLLCGVGFDLCFTCGWNAAWFSKLMEGGLEFLWF